MLGIFFIPEIILIGWIYFVLSQIQLNFSDILTIIGIIISVVVAIVLFHFQNTATKKLLILQNDVTKVNHALNLLTETEIKIYSAISPFVSDCYMTATKLHPLRAAQNPIKFQENQDEYYKWFLDQYLKSREKAHAILSLAETNKDFLPENIIEALHKFGEECENHSIQYYSTYMNPILQSQPPGQYMIDQQLLCYSQNEIIEATYRTYHELVQKRISQLKCSEL